MNSKQLRKQTKQKIKTLGISKRNKYITLICTKCNREVHIHTNNFELYTEEIKKSYSCINCK